MGAVVTVSCAAHCFNFPWTLSATGNLPPQQVPAAAVLPMDHPCFGSLAAAAAELEAGILPGLAPAGSATLPPEGAAERQLVGAACGRVAGTLHAEMTKEPSQLLPWLHNALPHAAPGGAGPAPTAAHEHRVPHAAAEASAEDRSRPCGSSRRHKRCIRGCRGHRQASGGSGCSRLQAVNSTSFAARIGRRSSRRAAEGTQAAAAAAHVCDAASGGRGEHSARAGGQRQDSAALPAQLVASLSCPLA